MSPIRVFIGYDTREAVAFHTLAHSIHRRASLPVSITPIMLSQLDGVFQRETSNLQSTEFSFSRFLVPYLCKFEGWAVFMDCDMLMVADIAELWAHRDDQYAVMCVQHDHQPTEDTKFLSAKQTRYEKKNWSSVMLLNCAKCTALTPDYVNGASGLELHQFKWLEGDHLIGRLPATWNHLVDYDPEAPVTDLHNLHFTSGGPYFAAYRDSGYADLWYQELTHLLTTPDGLTQQ